MTQDNEMLMRQKSEKTDRNDRRKKFKCDEKEIQLRQEQGLNVMRIKSE